jgi:heme-degrading monooxygenase HmoA
MFIRIAEVALVPALVDEARTIYARDAAPRVQRMPGNRGCYLLEPVTPAAHHLACTVWETEQDAMSYETSGTAKEVAASIRHCFASPPVLRSYRRP